MDSILAIPTMTNSWW